MLFQSINRSLPERVYINVFNAEASTALANGEICIWKVGLTEATGAGVHVLRSTAATQIHAAGVAIGAVAAQTYGLIQIYGLHTAVKTTGTVTEGTHLVKTSATAATGMAATVGTDGEVAIGPCVITASGNLAGVMIRLM